MSGDDLNTLLAWAMIIAGLAGCIRILVTAIMGGGR